MYPISPCCSKVLKILGGRELYPYARMELGNSYLHLQYFDKALDLFLKGCARNPSSGMYLGVGIACYRLGDLVNAEAALLEGNVLDPSNFKIWAFIALICLAMERIDEASIAFTQALKTFASASLLKELASAFAAKGKYRNAEIALSEALKEEESMETRLHLANMHFHQGKLDLAKTEYDKILQQEDTLEEVRMRATAALADVLSAEKRFFENVSAS
eukprot:Gb_01616 [translate_table: standard]